MEAEGFEYVVAPKPDGPDVEPRPYGFDDLQAARAEGFGLDLPTAGSPADGSGDAAVAPDPAVDPNGAYVRGLSPAQQAEYSEAMSGPPGGRTGSVELPGGGSLGFFLDGCLAEAYEQLYGDAEDLLAAQAVVGNLLTPVQQRVLEHAEYRDALRAWRDCMAGAGYRVERPSDATRLAIEAHGRDPRTAKDAEIEIAVDSATCARSSELVETGERLEREAWAEALEEHAAAIAAYEELREPALERAKEILEGP